MQSGIAKHAGIAWSIAVLASAFVLVASVAGPRPAFATLCHQLPSRSFVVDGHLFAVCHRCTGIYTGIFVGVLVTAFPAVGRLVSRYGLILVGVAVALVLLDFGLDFVGIMGNSPTSRVVTGSALGLGGGAFLGEAILGSGRRTVYRVPGTEYRVPNTAPSSQPITDNR